MKKMSKVGAIVVCIGVSLTSGCNTTSPQLGGLGGSKTSGSAAGKLSTSSIQSKLDASIVEVGVARKKLLGAQLKMLEALGKKEAADAIVSGSNVLREGGVVTPANESEIEESVKVSRQLNAELEKFNDETVKLNEEQKAIFTEAKSDFRDGLLLEAGQVAVLVLVAKEAKENLEGVKKNPLKAPKAAALSGAAAKMASWIPGDVKAMHGTWTVMRKVGADNEIEMDDIDIDSHLSGPGN